jgi:hypothetical protein
MVIITITIIIAGTLLPEWNIIRPTAGIIMVTEHPRVLQTADPLPPRGQQTGPLHQPGLQITDLLLLRDPLHQLDHPADHLRHLVHPLQTFHLHPDRIQWEEGEPGAVGAEVLAEAEAEAVAVAAEGGKCGNSLAVGKGNRPSEYMVYATQEKTLMENFTCLACRRRSYL